VRRPDAPLGDRSDARPPGGTGRTGDGQTAAIRLPRRELPVIRAS